MHIGGTKYENLIFPHVIHLCPEKLG